MTALSQLLKLLVGADVHGYDSAAFYQLQVATLCDHPYAVPNEMVDMRWGGRLLVHYHIHKLHYFGELEWEVVLVAPSDIHPGPLDF